MACCSAALSIWINQTGRERNKTEASRNVKKLILGSDRFSQRWRDIKMNWKGVLNCCLINVNNDLT